MKRMLKSIPMVQSLNDYLKKLEYERRFSGNCFACFRGVFETQEQALLSAPKNDNKICYSDSELVEVYKVELTASIQSFDYPVLFWLKDLVNDNVKIFDFGGSVGIHYYSYQKYISYPESLKWIVCELPRHVKTGKKLAEGKSQLVFTSSFEEASGTDIFIGSGSIQYVENLSQSLSLLADKPKHLFINRLPLYDGKQFFTLQNIKRQGLYYVVNSFYPQCVFNKKDFISSIQSIGYELVDIWEDRADGCFIPFYPENSLPFYYGLYFKLGS